MKLIIEATKEMLFCAQRSSEWCVIDARSSDIYMGWKHGNEKAGHIPYAKFFSRSGQTQGGEKVQKTMKSD